MPWAWHVHLCVLFQKITSCWWVDDIGRTTAQTGTEFGSTVPNSSLSNPHVMGELCPLVWVEPRLLLTARSAGGQLWSKLMVRSVIHVGSKRLCTLSLISDGHPLVCGGIRSVAAECVRYEVNQTSLNTFGLKFSITTVQHNFQVSSDTWPAPNPHSTTIGTG